MSTDVAGRRALLLVALAVVLVGAGAVFVPPSGVAAADQPPTRAAAQLSPDDGAQSSPDDGTQPSPDDLHLVSVDPESDERLWPYTSRRESFDSATLPINVVVRKNAVFVRYLLTTTTGATWEVSESTAGNATDRNESDVESGVVLNGTGIEWTSARGSTRYTYVHDQKTGTGRWIDETYQLHDGTYLGSRYHLRLYDGGSGPDGWTAIQAHREHWDWFRLRHTVDSVDGGQAYVEREFYGTWFLEDVGHARFANTGPLDSDGWVSVIRLTDRQVNPPIPAGFVFVLGLVAVRRASGTDASSAIQRVRRRLEREWAERRRAGRGWMDLRPVLLFASLSLLPLAVRVSGIWLERGNPELSPKVIAAGLYLVLVLGIPGCAFAFSRRVTPQTGAIIAAGAFGAGMLLDYAYLAIAVLPLDVVGHRALLLVAVGLLAAGGSLRSRDDRRWRWLVAAGVITWLVGLAVPLLDLY